MNVWLVSPWEPNPLDHPEGRRWRTGSLAEMLISRGHHVTWWASNFAHMTKEFRMEEPGSVQLREGLTMRVLPALGYRRHVSLARLRDHRHVASQFRKQVRDVDVPDLIVASYPTIDLASEAVRYAAERDVPVIVDVRDQWPDTFTDAFPRIVHGLLWLVTRGIDARANRIFRNATGIFANGEGTLDWALRRADRDQRDADGVFPMGYPKLEFADPVREASESFWRDRGLSVDSDEVVVAFVGSMTRHFDFDTVIEAAKVLDRDKAPVRFVLCGSGEELERLKGECVGLSNIQFPGWVEAPQVQALLRLASIGIAPYQPSENFMGGITNKPVEYLSEGLPIATCLDRGSLHELIVERECGFVYTFGNSEDLTDRLRALAGDRLRLGHMSRHALRAFEDRFEEENVYGGMSGHLESIVRKFSRSLNVSTPSAVQLEPNSRGTTLRTE